ITYIPPASGTVFPNYDVLSVTATRTFSDHKADTFTSTKQIPILKTSAAADLSVTTVLKNSATNTVPPYFLPGDPANNTVPIVLTAPNSNTANTVNATGVKVTGGLPFGVAVMGAPVLNPLTAGSYDSATGIWTIGNLAKGASATLTFTATVSP